MSSEESSNLTEVITIAQALLRKEMLKGADITPTLVEAKVSIAAALFSDEVDAGTARDELIRRFSHWIGANTTMVDNEGHFAWLVGGRRKDWRYWPRYHGFLDERMSATAVDALDRSTDEILGLLEDPQRPGAWDRRGLVVGHVQSGKTGNYSGLICKAADSGYKIIIVLAGLHNNLRSQTQVRLEESFLGYETSISNDRVNLIGVGLTDSDAEIRPNCGTNRSNQGDFNTKVARHYSISPEQRPWLFVVKKNKTVLERLLRWIRLHVADSTDAITGRRFVSNLPLLLIDDEADHASVDTGEQLFNEDGTPDSEHEPKAINSRIRKLLHSFAKSAYVGYTATPFANIFIHRRNATADEGPDLFPQAFIMNLAAPSNYVGPVRVFGLRSTEGRLGGLPLIRPVASEADEKMVSEWMPPKHNKSHVPSYGGRDQVPPSLREAIGAFVLACAVRHLRGQSRQHSSMLVHVTRFTMVQSHVHRQVSDVVARMRTRISRRVDHEDVHAELERLWMTDFATTSPAVSETLSGADKLPALPAWEQVLEALPDVLSDIEVRMINGTAKDALDYAIDRPKGLTVIAIGGDKLARGLTLEGLCISYFVRTSKMYDTLMQMGRWFGYRPGYLDICRLYTTSELVDWFGHIAEASEELRQEFDAMAESGATPKEYGLKVQSHPVLTVTSPLKMRSARSLFLSFSGECLETVNFYRDAKVLRHNLAATDALILRMGEPSEIDPERERGGRKERAQGSYLWDSVPADAVIEFLGSYTGHPRAQTVRPSAISEFIRKMAAIGELESWTVVLFGGGLEGGEHMFARDLWVQNMPRRAPRKVYPDGYSIGRLLSPPHEAIDLDEVAWSAALAATIKAWKPDPARQQDSVRSEPPKVPNGPAIRRVRGEGAAGVPAARHRGLLLLYPLDPPRDPPLIEPEDPTLPVIAFGVSLPTSRSGTLVEYQVDHLLWEAEYGPAD